MSQQGPILVVSSARRPSFAHTLDEAKLFPVLDAGWADAARAVGQLAPAAVLVASPDGDEATLRALAARIAATRPYLPLIAVDATGSLPENAIPFAQSGGNSDRLMGAVARRAAGADLAFDRDAPARQRPGGARHARR